MSWLRGSRCVDALREIVHQSIIHVRLTALHLNPYFCCFIYSGTFFTLQHDVVDISTPLSHLYEEFDAVKLEGFMSEVKINALRLCA